MPIDPHPAVICSLERLRPFDGLDENYYFGLNLAVALVAGDDGDSRPFPNWAHLVKTWFWQRIDKVLLGWTDWSFSNPGNRGHIEARVIQPEDLTFANFDFSGLYDRLTKRLAKMQQQATLELADQFAPLRWKPDDPSEQTGNPERSWKHLQTRLSQEPYPLPQIMNLTLALRVPKAALASAETKFLFAAPEFTARDSSNASDWIFHHDSTSEFTQVGTTDMARWKYSASGAQAPSSAYSYHLKLPFDRGVRDDAFFNFNDFWIYPKGSPDRPESLRAIEVPTWDSRNWAARLKELIAQFVDLPQQLLDVGWQRLPDASCVGLPAKLASAVLAALHDTANAGLLARPDERSLIDDVLESLFCRYFTGDVKVAHEIKELAPFVQRVLWEGLVLSARDALLRLEDVLTLPAWKAILQSDLPALADSPLLGGMPSSSGTRQEAEATLRELERLASALRQRDTLCELVLSLWKRAWAASVELAYRSGSEVKLDLFAQTYQGPPAGGVLNLSDPVAQRWLLTLPEWQYLPEMRFTVANSKNVTRYELQRRTPSQGGEFQPFNEESRGDSLPCYTVDVSGNEV
jgi:hypothetical protein